MFDHGDHIHSVCLSHCVTPCVWLSGCVPAGLPWTGRVLIWVSVGLGVSFPSPPLFHQLTDKVRDSSCLSFSAPDSLSFGRQAPDNPALPGTHHHQLILHHHFLICSLGAYFSGYEQTTPLSCVSTSLQAPCAEGNRPSDFSTLWFIVFCSVLLHE